MVFFIKFVHSIVFLLLCASLAVLAALATISVEIGAVAMARGACPLTIAAERLGAPSGSVVDLFLPAWLARRAFGVGGAIFLVSLFALSIRLALR
jgi:hypothetical protein